MLPESEEHSIANMMYCVELFRVADKDDLPMLYRIIPRIFHTQLASWLSRAHAESKDPDIDEKNVEMFCDLVERVYTLPNTKPSHPLVTSLLEMTDHAPLRILRNDGKKSSMLIKAAKDVAEFGRDVFLVLMDKMKSEVNTKTRAKSITELDLVSQVRCPKCKIILRLASEWFDDEGFCLGCGHYVVDWSECEELEPVSPGSSV